MSIQHVQGGSARSTVLAQPRAMDAQRSSAWITEYLAWHPGAAANDIDPFWAEALARTGPSIGGQVTDLFRRLNQLQDRLDALEEAATRSKR